MRIAVTFENDNIFPHFGHAEHFKLYDAEDGVITAARVMDTGCSGHGAMTALLTENGVDVVICGGMGEGAMNALADAGIEVCSGITGSADEAVVAFLRGELTSQGINCDHHSEGGCGCGCGDDADEGCGGSCGGGCSGGCGGCGGAPRIIMEGKNAGKTVRVHYRGTLNDGSQFDASYDRGEPLEFICGAGMMIHGFDAAVLNMEVGDEIDIHLMPEEAYGDIDPDAIFTLPIMQIPGSEDLSVGQQVYLVNAMGQPFPVRVTAKDDETITFDANPDMAGKELNFHIELLSAQ